VLAVAMAVVGMAASVFNLARQKYLTEAVPIHFRARALSLTPNRRPPECPHCNDAAQAG
jgi:hypothetical protein